MTNGRISTALVSTGILLAAAPAQADNINPSALLNMSLEQLSNIEVTSVSKKAEKANEAAAAIFVITQEDIKRSGATNIPDILRMAPGIDVAQAGAHDWAVTARGFNNQFANKLLVLIDGRTVYNPLFSGTFWQVQDTLLEDIDRIEVIRGPGATQWGANAVNGVINIITKSAKDTQGGMLSASAGNMVKSDDGTRYGIKIGDDSYARVYAKYTDDAPEFNVGTGRSGDGWQKRQAGFRSDSKLSSEDSLTLQGDAYSTHQAVNYSFPNLTTIIAATPGDIEATGGNILSRWTKTLSPESATTTQFYVDNTQYKNGFISYNATTADLDFQHTWTGWKDHQIIWGAAYRLIEDHNGATSLLSVAPIESSNSLYSAFLQDKYTLLHDVFLTVGSKFEHNAFTGFEVQPSARLSWLISDTQMAWGSVSRAIHTPGRSTDNTQFVLGVAPPHTIIPALAIPTQITVVGNAALDSEDLIAYELGYRIQPIKSVSLDVATFYNDYSKLFLAQYGPGVNMGSYYFLPESAQNANSAYSDGFELSTKVDATQNWQLSGTYSYLNLHFTHNTTGVEFSAIGQQPKNTFNIRSTYLFPGNVEMTNSLYYVDGFSQYDIPGYYRFDTKLSHEIIKGVEISLIGQNLLTAYHREFAGFLYQNPVEIGRSVYANVTLKF